MQYIPQFIYKTAHIQWGHRKAILYTIVWLTLSKIYIQSTLFLENKIDNYIITASKASLKLSEVLFHGNIGKGLIAFNFRAASLHLHGQVNISENRFLATTLESVHIELLLSQLKKTPR